MTSGIDPVDARLLEIAKELLEASEACAEHDPHMAEKFAREAYEIGRSLGLIHELVARDRVAATPLTVPPPQATAFEPLDRALDPADDDAEEILIRLLDRQRHVVSTAAEAPTTRTRGAAGRRWWPW